MNRPNKKRRLPSLAAVLTVLLMMALGFGAGWLGAWMADHADLAGWQLLALLGGGCGWASWSRSSCTRAGTWRRGSPPGTGSYPSASAASCC